MTLIGALGGSPIKFVYKLYTTTNAENMVDFLEQIEKQFPAGLNTVLVLDNHRAHHSKKVTHELTLYCFETLFLPAYSCQLNPIERLWAQIKHRWGLVLLKKMGDVTVSEAKTEIEDICQTIGREPLDGYYNSNRKAIQNVLNGQVV
jgi:transposase